jgi:hypothetical protein
MLLPGSRDTTQAKIPTLNQAQDDLGPTTGRLLAAFAAAVAETSEYCDSKGERDRSFANHLTRYLAKVELRDDGVQPKDCELEDVANSGICLSLPDYLVRVVKAGPDGEVPDPGDSERRKRFLQQQPELQIPLAFMEPEPAKNEEEAEPVHIMYLWEVDSRGRFTGFWFVCPNGVGKYYFKAWIPFEEGLGLLLSPAPANEPPPSALGFTKKSEPSREQTGTDENTE